MTSFSRDETPAMLIMPLIYGMFQLVDGYASAGIYKMVTFINSRMHIDVIKIPQKIITEDLTANFSHETNKHSNY